MFHSGSGWPSGPDSSGKNQKPKLRYELDLIYRVRYFNLYVILEKDFCHKKSYIGIKYKMSNVTIQYFISAVCCCKIKQN